MAQHVFVHVLHIGVALIWFFCMVHGIHEFTRFQHLATLDNKQCTTNMQSFYTKVHSSIHCGHMCDIKTDCDSIFYSETTHDCIGCVAFISPENGTEEASGGTLYYKSTVLSLAGPEDCLTIKQNDPSSTSGVYTVTLSSNRDIEVYCDMETRGGGWTVFQYRSEGSVIFDLTYQEYTDGFGDIGGEFWLGLQNIHEMAPPDIQSEFYIFLDNGVCMSFYLLASVFSVGDGTCYRSTFENGDFPIEYNSGVCFSAKDQGYSTFCANNQGGGWWHDNCTFVNPNGPYDPPTAAPVSPCESVATTKLMFRRNG